MTALSTTRPAFIVCHGRAGSTLLRYLLDTHPEIACPAESIVVNACLSVSHLYDQLQVQTERRIRLDDPATNEAADAARRILDQLIDPFVAARGKSVWCDKSLPTALALRDVTAVFPDARYICLYRHAMDFIGSGLEAMRWGITEYGFDSYTRRSPENLVCALADYWNDRVERMLELENSDDVTTLRVRYEDLTTFPVETLTRICTFLEVDASPSVMGMVAAAALEQEHGRGKGDHKIDFTSSVSEDSLGRGRAIPTSKLGRHRAQDLNRLLKVLDYSIVGPDWNVGEGGTCSNELLTSDSGVERYWVQAAELMTRRLKEVGTADCPPFELAVASRQGTIVLCVEPETRQVSVVDWGSDSGGLRVRTRVETYRSLLRGLLTVGDAVLVQLLQVSRDGTPVRDDGRPELRLLAQLVRPLDLTEFV